MVEKEIRAAEEVLPRLKEIGLRDAAIHIEHAVRMAKLTSTEAWDCRIENVVVGIAKFARSIEAARRILTAEEREGVTRMTPDELWKSQKAVDEIYVAVAEDVIENLRKACTWEKAIGVRLR